MFSRWKTCSSKFLIVLLLFFVVYLLFIWGLIANKQNDDENTASGQTGFNPDSTSGSISGSANDRTSQTQDQTETDLDLSPQALSSGEGSTTLGPFINRQLLQGGLGELEFKVWLNRETWKQSSTRLVEAVRQVFLFPPSKEPYNLSLSNAIKTNPSDGQVQAVEKFLKKLTPGFFVECGANDGELNSNTIWLEKEMGWTGLLVEADPYAFQKLKQKNRKAWLANVCFSGYEYPKQVTFYRNPVTSEAGGLIYDPYYGAIVPSEAQCIPLYTMLLALNRTTVDFLALDVEGNELQILKTIPFDTVVFKVMTIDHLFIEEGKRALWDFMKSKGYILYKTVRTKITGDSIFIHPSVFKEIEKDFKSSKRSNSSDKDKDKDKELSPSIHNHVGS